MSIKMQVPVGHATALMGSYPQELRKAKAEVKKVTELMEVLRGIQWRMGAWVRGEYLLREFKEVCAADVLKLDEVLAARERGEFDMTCKVKDAVRLVHWVLICIAEARTKVKVSSMADSGNGYIIEARKLLKLRQLVQYSKVKTFRRANKNLSRCRTTAVKLSKREKLAIVCKRNPDLGTWVREWAADGTKHSYGSVMGTAVYSHDYDRPKGETIARRLSASVRCELAGKAFYASANTAYNRLNCWLEILRYGESLMAMRQRKNQTQLFAERLPDVRVKVWE